MKKYLVEFIGTFFFVLTIGLCVVAPGPGALAPIAIGSALMVMIFAGGHISGGHYNPAVTLAATLRGASPIGNLLPYWIAQLAGAAVAAAVVMYLKGSGSRPIVIDIGPALLAEFLYTFALCWVVLHVATAKGTSGNSFYGLAIGFTVMVGAFSVGAISGGAFNPAVALGITILKLSAWSNLWVFLVANFAAAIAAAVVFKFVDSSDA